jgi:hypothetical protein
MEMSWEPIQRERMVRCERRRRGFVDDMVVDWRVIAEYWSGAYDGVGGARWLMAVMRARRHVSK